MTNTATTTTATSIFHDDADAELMKDVTMLGSSLGRVVKSRPVTGPTIYGTSNLLLMKARSCREARQEARGTEEEAGKLKDLVEHVSSLRCDQIRETARSFNTFLALTNAAEANHRVRQHQVLEAESGSLSVENYHCYPMQPHDTTLGAMQRLLSATPVKLGFHHGRCSPVAASASPDEIYQALSTQCVEIVLTAHPTKVNRRTVVRQHRAINEALAARDGTSVWFEREEHEATLQRAVETLWTTDEIRRTKPTPQKEAGQGLEIVASSMWHAVPGFLRRLDRELLRTPGIEKELPPDVAPVRFGSWIGGDRDGNPNVTAAVTKEVVVMSRLRAARLVQQSLKELAYETSGKMLLSLYPIPRR